MTGVKFECPGCGQHIECDKACCGDVIHCPRCCAELRIPFAKPQEIPGTIERAEMLMHAPAPPTAGLGELNISPGEEEKKAQPESIQVCCPVCQSELRVKANAVADGSSPPVAEILSAGKLQLTPGSKQEPPKKPVEQQKTQEKDPPHPDVNHMSFEERERHIAAAREARPVSLYGSMKPRLDKVLSEELAPVKADNGEGEKTVRRPPRGAEGGANPEGFTE